MVCLLFLIALRIESQISYLTIKNFTIELTETI